MLATASKAIIVGFHVKTELGGKKVAETERVDIRHYQIIYELIEDVEKAVKGLMEPVIVEVIDGHAEVRAVFRVRGGRIAGCMVTDGLVRRNSLARVLRDGEMIHEIPDIEPARFKEDVREVTAGLECGIGVGEVHRLPGRRRDRGLPHGAEGLIAVSRQLSADSPPPAATRA